MEEFACSDIFPNNFARSRPKDLCVLQKKIDLLNPHIAKHKNGILCLKLEVNVQLYYHCIGLLLHGKAQAYFIICIQ